MKALLWLNARWHAVRAWWATRRAFRRYHMSLTELRRLHQETRRRTP